MILKVTFDWNNMILSFPWKGEVTELHGVNLRVTQRQKGETEQTS